MKKLIFAFIALTVILFTSCQKEIVTRNPQLVKTGWHTDHLDNYDMLNVSDSLAPSYEWSDFDTIHQCGNSTVIMLEYNKSYFVQMRHSQNSMNSWIGYVKYVPGTGYIITQTGGPKTLILGCGGLKFIN